AIGGDHLTVKAGDAFGYFRTNYKDTDINLYDWTGDYPSDAGSYYIACLMYETLFGKSPVGMEATGLIDKEGAAILQKAAHKFVFGTEPKATSHPGKPYDEFKYEEYDPRLQTTRDPRFKDEKYPQYYDELWAIAYATCTRGWDVQYDKSTLSQNFKGVKGVTNALRRQRSLGPDRYNSQHVSYLDCSAFCDMVYNYGFDYDPEGNDTAGMIKAEKGRHFYWDGAAPEFSPEDAAEKFIEALEPGDIIIQRGSSAGHAMLYVGNGWIAHCTNTHEGGDSNDYNHLTKNDSPEIFGGMTFDKIDVLTTPGGAYYTFSSSLAVNVFNPFRDGIKPNEAAVLRAKYLTGVITYKECSAYQYGTASKGSDVTFTYVFRNDTKEDKTVTLTDKLPEGLAYKSGEVSFTNGALELSVKIPARGTVKKSFTATVTAENGTRIDCGDTKVCGVPQNATPFTVRNTLPNGGKAITDAYKSVSASNDLDYINAVYKKALGRETTIGNKADFIKNTFEIKDEKTCGKIFNDLMVNQYTFGGASCLEMNTHKSFRLRNIEMRDLIAGDVIAVLKDINTLELWLYVGEGKLAVFEEGKL
ncbi:MAG: C40 family peptidase, partial [Clostridia bacterium]|nr:C40 family peptidase [Clostridia bacterium]